MKLETSVVKDNTAPNIADQLGKRFNNGKTRWSLVDFSALEPMIRVLVFGEKKYGTDNWKKGLPYRGICESMMRHLIAFLEGEDKDPESKLDVTGHILCNAMLLSYMYKNRKDLDDR